MYTRIVFFAAIFQVFLNTCVESADFESIGFKKIGGHIVSQDVNPSFLNSNLPALPCVSSSSFSIKVPSDIASVRQDLVDAAFNINQEDFVIPSSLDVFVSFVPENSAAPLVLQNWAFNSQDDVDDAPLDIQVALFNAQGSVISQGRKSFAEGQLSTNSGPISLSIPARSSRYSIVNRLTGMYDFFALSVLDDGRGALSYFIMDNGSFNILASKYNQNPQIKAQDYLDSFDDLTVAKKSSITTTTILLAKKFEFSAGRKKLSFSTKGLKFVSDKVLQKKVSGQSIEFSITKKGSALNFQAKLNKKLVAKVVLKKRDYTEKTVVQNIPSPILSSTNEAGPMQNLLALTGLLPDSLADFYESSDDLVADESMDASLKAKLAKKKGIKYKSKKPFSMFIKLKDGSQRKSNFSKKVLLKRAKVKRKFA